MANIDFKQSAEQMVALVGGKENVATVTHCITRVRFSLKNNEIARANTEKIAKLEGVIQVVEAGGQYQVVIGPKVTAMYNEVINVIGTEMVNDESTSKEGKKGFMGNLMKLISGIMMPVMPAMIGCGLVTALNTILTMLGVYTSESMTAQIFTAIGNACMYFFPVLIGCSAAKFFKMDTYIGAVIGAALMHPNLVAGAGTTDVFLGVIPLTLKDYSSTVFPAIVTVLFASVLYKFLKKHIPSMISFFTVPFLTILVSVPTALLIIGPVVNILSEIVSQATLAIYNINPVICGMLLGGAWLLFVVPLGVHWGFLAIFMNNIVTLGYEPIMGLLSGILALSGTLFAVSLKSKNAETKSLAMSAAIMNFLGISEPGLYGVVLQHKETIITTFIGGAIAGIIPAVMHTYVYIMGGASGIFALTAYINPNGNMSSLLGAIFCNIVGFVICFILTMLWRFDPDSTNK